MKAIFSSLILSVAIIAAVVSIEKKPIEKEIESEDIMFV
jgi:hypothetical protein